MFNFILMCYSVNGHVAVVKMEIAKENQEKIVRKVQNTWIFYVFIL